MKPDTLRNAAVLVPVHLNQSSELSITMIRRSDFGIHGGQLAFPGGKQDEGDNSLFATAVREAHEEIGLLESQIIKSRALPVFSTLTGFVIHPFLGLIVPPRVWVIDEKEVDEILTCTLNEIAQSESSMVVKQKGWERPLEVDCYTYFGTPLWGASYRILKPLVDSHVSGIDLFST